MVYSGWVKERMLTDYIQAAMRHAAYEKLEDGSFYGEIPDCQGVWSQELTLELCRETLQEVLEEWIVMKLRDGDPLPPIDGIGVAVGAA